MEQAFTIEKFWGIVASAEWFDTIGGHFRSFAGEVTLYPATQLVSGWEPGGRYATWVAEIAGPTSTVYVMGCQVRAITRLSELPDNISNPNVCMVP